MNIDIWEVIEAAKTKPYGFMPFYPGPGVGGHCIPIDPFYLAWKAKEFDFRTRFIELAGEINMKMPYHIVNRLMEGLNKYKNLGIGRARILILGVAYKRDIADLRESPALKIIEILHKKRATIYYNDPYIPEIILDEIKLKSRDLNEDLFKEVDATILATNHSCYNYEWISKHIDLLLDTRNAFKGYKKDIIKI
jgi:UDP-N-acetyl-D-glucosamine dehydrogenase